MILQHGCSEAHHRLREIIGGTIMGRKRRERLTEHSGMTNKVDKKSARYEGKASIISAKAGLANAKASKRKWLVALIVVGMLAYLTFKMKLIGG